MAIDLDKLENKVNEVLENETPESMREWLENERRRTRLIDLPITLRELAVKNQIAQGNERDVYAEIKSQTISYNVDGTISNIVFHFSETLKYRLDGRK